MGPRVLSYERRGAYRRRWGVWLVIVAIASAVTATAGYHAATSRKPRFTQSRSSVSYGKVVSLGSQLTLFAEHHGGQLPASLELLEKDERGVCYWHPGTFRRVPNAGGAYPLYAFPFRDRPFLREYRGTGLTTDSRGAVVFHWIDAPTSSRMRSTKAASANSTGHLASRNRRVPHAKTGILSGGG